MTYIPSEYIISILDGLPYAEANLVLDELERRGRAADAMLAALKELCHLMPTGACADGLGAERDAAQDRGFAAIKLVEASLTLESKPCLN